MRYALRTFFGLGLMVMAVTVTAYCLYQLLQIGTCASGGPYVSARECPDGTGRLIVGFFPAVVVLLIGTALYASRGRAPGSDREAPKVGAVLVLWSLLFIGLGAAALWGVWGPDANPGPGGELGGLIVGFLFLVMGLLPIPFALRWALGGDADARTQSAMAPLGTRADLPTMPGAGSPTAPGSRAASTAFTAPTGGDKVARLEKLNQLRRDGAVSDAEFERLKAEIVSE